PRRSRATPRSWSARALAILDAAEIERPLERVLGQGPLLVAVALRRPGDLEAAALTEHHVGVRDATPAQLRAGARMERVRRRGRALGPHGSAVPPRVTDRLVPRRDVQR